MQDQNLELEEKKFPSFGVTSPSSFMAYSFSSLQALSLIGDCIGMESCLDPYNNEEVDFAPASLKKQDSDDHDHDHDHLQYGYHHERRVKKDQRCKEMRKEFPPPIPLLARTENLSCHMPWVLKRHYTSDGRLILREEKVRHHEYFRAHRCNGRLTLQLIPLDIDVLGLPFTQEREEEEEQDVQVCDMNEGNRDVIDRRLGIKEEEEMEHEEDQRVPSSMESGIGGNGSGSGKCFSYNTSVVTPRSTCIFCVPVPATGPVHG